MALEEKINADIKAAMIAKQASKLEALRAIKSAILMMKTSGEAITEEAEMKTLQKMVKQRKEAAEIYKTQNREDLASVELEQAAVIEAYLPAKMSREELTKELKEIIAEVGAKSVSDLGKVMGIASKKFAGKADGREISELVKQLLS